MDASSALLGCMSMLSMEMVSNRQSLMAKL
jgi:hypothetical protein